MFCLGFFFSFIELTFTFYTFKLQISRLVNYLSKVSPFQKTSPQKYPYLVKLYLQLLLSFLITFKIRILSVVLHCFKPSMLS